MNLNDISNSIYVLNLKKRDDRRKQIINELEKIQCVNYILFESVDGYTLENNTRLSPGMFGLVLTYLKIYETWKTLNYDNILIIEDDCMFVPNFNIKLKQYIDKVPNDWEMIYFGGNHNYHMGFKTQQINDECVKLNNTYSAHCVLLKNYVFEDLINNLKTTEIENDVMMARLQKKYNAYSPTKKLATQLPDFSNIENKYVDHNWLIK